MRIHLEGILSAALVEIASGAWACSDGSSSAVREAAAAVRDSAVAPPNHAQLT